MGRVKRCRPSFALLVGLSPLFAPGPSPAAPERAWTDGAEELRRQEARLWARAERGDEVAIAELYRLLNLARLLDQVERLRPALERTLRAPRLDALTRDHLRLLLAELHHDAGEAAQAAARLQEAGVVSEAWLIGPFDNGAGGGHELAHPPELGLDLAGVQRGRNHPVAWRHAKGLAPTGVFHLSELLRPESEATAYLLFAVESSRRVEATLRVGASDRLKVFYDGTEVFATDRLRPAAWDQEAIPLLVEPGVHSILVKVSYTEARGELRVRLAASGGGASADLSISARPEDLERARGGWGGGRPARHAVRGLRDPLDRAIARARGPAAAELLALRSDLSAVLSLYDERKLPPPPEVDLERSLELDPGRVWSRFFLGHRLEQRDPSRAREQLEAALAIEPTHVPSLWKLATAHARVGRSTRARELLDEALRLDPSFAAAVQSRLELDGESRFRARLAVDRLRRHTQAAPSPTLLAELATRLMDAGLRTEAIEKAQAALRIRGGHLPALRVLHRAALDAGDLELAQHHLEQEIARSPWRLSPRLERIRIMLALGASPERGLEALGQLAPLFPDAPELWDLQAELLQRSARTPAAALALERSLELDPQRPDVRRHRDVLAKVSSQLEDTYSIDPSTLTDRPVEADEAAVGAAVLSERWAVRLYDNGQATRFRQTVTRISHARQRDALRHDRIYYSPSRETVEVLSAERIRPSGVIERAARVSDAGPSGKVGGMYVDVRSKNILFQDLEPGDLVHVRYRVDSIGANIFGGFFGDTALLSGPIPKYDLLYVAESPKERPLFAGQAHAPAPRVEDRDATRVTEWRIPHLPALEPEPMAPPLTELATTVSVSTYRSWEDLAQWFARLYREQLELDEATRRAAHEVVRGATSELEKVQRLHDYVVKNTRYVGIELGIHGWKPFKASEVHRRRYGDCKDKATLLSAMLREVGVEATVTLIRTVDRGPFLADHASMWAFNHAITYVPGLDLFLDGTAEHAGSRELPWQDQGGVALVVYPDGRSQAMVPPESPPVANLNRSDYRARLRLDGSLQLVGEEHFRGARASAVRQEMQEVERRREGIEQHLNQILPGAHVTELEFSDLSRLEEPVWYRYGVEVPRYGRVEGASLILPATLFQHRIADAYAVLAERKTDLVIDHAWETTNRVEYEVPAGLRVVELPESLRIDSEYLRLEQTLSRTERGFVVRDTVTFKRRRVPAASYPEFRRAALEIDRGLARRVVLSR